MTRGGRKKFLLDKIYEAKFFLQQKLAQISHVLQKCWFKDFAGPIWCRHRLLYFITNIKVTNMKEIQQGNLLGGVGSNENPKSDYVIYG